MPLAVHESPALSWLHGARVQRVDGPFAGCLALTLYQRGDKSTLVLLFAPHVRGVGSVAERPKGLAASAFVQRVRSQIEGARLLTASWLSHDASDEHALALRLAFQRSEHGARMIVDFDRKLPNLFLLHDDAVAFAADERMRRERFPERASLYELGRGDGIRALASADALRDQGEQLIARDAQRALAQLRNERSAQTRAALKRVERKIAAIRGDLARAELAPKLRAEGNALLCHLGSIPRGAARVDLLDPNSDPPTLLEVTLDPAKSAQQNAEQRFERARKLERGVAIASARLRESELEAAELRTRLSALESATPEELATPRSAPRPRRKMPEPRTPYRVFFGEGGAKILVGKGAADNDTLTLTVARPHDHFLHVRGVAGSHVIVPLEKKAPIQQELLLDAAHLAAHFSKQRGEPLVEIAHSERRFVRKPKGAAAGSVNLDRERVFVLRLEPTRLTRLLASERA